MSWGSRGDRLAGGTAGHRGFLDVPDVHPRFERNTAARRRGGGVARLGALRPGRPRDLQQGPGRQDQPGGRPQRRLHVRHEPEAGGESCLLRPQGGQSSSVYGVECNVGSSCTSQWGNSVQTITERPAAGYTLTAIACYHTQGSNGWPSEPNTSSARDTDTTSDLAARKIDFKLNWWEWTKCYVTNTRDTGTIKVTKKLLPATDGGKFNLLIDGQAKATNVGDGGTTGTQTVLPGTHTVGEAAGTATDLSNYDSSTSCVDQAHTAKPADTDGSLAVAKGDQWECVITNTR